LLSKFRDGEVGDLCRPEKNHYSNRISPLQFKKALEEETR
jgi:hypothetical protein